MKTQYFEAVGRARAVTLVVHGLNVRPDAMIAYIRLLTGDSSDVYLVSLSGHYRSAVDIERVNASLWQAEMLEGFGRARQRAAELAVPVYFLGYSLGALLAQSMIALMLPRACFERQVLIAPAIALRWHCYLLKGLFFFGAKKRLPSYTPKQYRVHRSLPLGIYQILFKEEQKLVQAQYKSLNIPTLVIIDPEDELISYKKLKAYREHFGLNQCRVLPLNPSLKGRSIKYHHCLVDAACMGEENWQLTTIKIREFLFNKATIPPENLES